jgi:regulatory protein SWI6
MEVNGVAVMRRRADSWLNATQILKVAGIDKGKRTKVLEKEILIGEHEKVQGGYGKYQGTWIKFEKGVEFCRSYGVEHLLRPLLTYDMGQDGGVAGRGGMETPTKEQAMAAQRKKLYNAGSDARINGQSGTFFKNISSTASHAVAAISKARYDSPGPRGRNGSTIHRPPAFSRQNSSQVMDESAFPGNSQQSMQSYVSDTGYTMNGQDSAYATQSVPPQSAVPNSYPTMNGDFQEPPRKRMRASPSISMSQQTEQMYGYDGARETTPTEPNESFVYHQHSQNGATIEMDEQIPVPLAPLPMSSTQSAEQKRAILMSLFVNPSQSDFSTHDAFRTLSPADLDLPIDNTAHTALHWAATLARLPLLKTLIAHGASIYRVNSGGETALMRACVVTNNLDMGSFPELLEFLGPTIEIRDDRGRTVVHHIAVTSAVKGRSQASKYYLESLLEFVVRQGSAPNSQTFGGNLYAHNNANGMVPKSMGIGRFMSEIVNAQDKTGDTALNIAARIGNRSIISQLLEVGADAGIPNRAGLRPVDFGIGNVEDHGAAMMGGQMDGGDDRGMLRPRETSGEIIGCESILLLIPSDSFRSPFPSLPHFLVSLTDIVKAITSLITTTEREFATELAARQKSINAIHSELRESSAMLGEQRRRLERIREEKKERMRRKIKIVNLRRAGDVERQRVAQLQSQSQGQYGGPDGQMHGLDTIGRQIASATSPDGQIDPQTLAALPSSQVLRQHLASLSQTNQHLSQTVRTLSRSSVDLEAKYRRIIALCTGVAEEEVDGLVGGLVRAVESEVSTAGGDGGDGGGGGRGGPPGGGGELDLGRVREFLVKVEGVGL